MYVVIGMTTAGDLKYKVDLPKQAAHAFGIRLWVDKHYRFISHRDVLHIIFSKQEQIGRNKSKYINKL